MRALIDRLMAKLGFMRVVPPPAPPTLEEACRQFGMREAVLRQQFANGIHAARCEAYQVGLAEGELVGRTELHREIAAQYGIDGGERNMTSEDVARIGVRQLH